MCVMQKNEAVAPKHDDHKTNNYKFILSAIEENVKQNDLKAIISSANLTPREVIAIVGEYFPSFDKAMLSKCMKPQKYGVVVHPLGLAAIYAQYPVLAEKEPEIAKSIVRALKPAKQRKSGKHKLTCRIAGRLPDAKYEQLQHYIKLDGYETMQDWVVSRVDIYLKEAEGLYGKLS